LIADQGIITAGAVDVCVWRRQTEELLFILADSGSTALVVEDRNPESAEPSPRLPFGGLALG